MLGNHDSCPFESPPTSDDGKRVAIRILQTIRRIEKYEVKSARFLLESGQSLAHAALNDFRDGGTPK